MSAKFGIAQFKVFVKFSFYLCCCSIYHSLFYGLCRKSKFRLEVPKTQTCPFWAIALGNRDNISKPENLCRFNKGYKLQAKGVSNKKVSNV